MFTSGSLNTVQHIRRKEIAIEWTIPDFFSEKYTCGINAESPSFQYLNTNWFLAIREFDSGYLDVGIYKRHVNRQRPWAYYTIGIKKTDGTVYKYQSGKKTLNKFDGSGETKEFVLLPDLFWDKGEIASQNALVVFCNLSLEDKYCLKGVTKNASAHSYDADACTDTLDEDFPKLRLQGNCSNVTLRSTPGIEKLGRNLKDLLLSGEDSDTVFIVGDKEFRAHKVILKSRSPVLAAMFRHKMKEQDSGSVNIIDCGPQAFEQFLLYVYTGEVDNLSPDNVCQIYQVADKYDLPDLKSGCVEFMQKNLCTENFCDFISLALLYKESALIEDATQYFVRNAKKIIITVKWLRFLKENPVEANELTIKVLNTGIQD